MPALFKIAVSLFLIVSLATCDFKFPIRNKLDQIKHKGVLHVLTRIDPTTYYEGPEGFTGLEFDLVMLFANHLGVEVRFETPRTFDEILNKIAKGKADIAAAGLTVTPERQNLMRFAPAYDEITEQIVYRSGKRKPNKVKDLTQGIIEVVKGTSHVETLAALKQKIPGLNWNINAELDTDALLYFVNEGLIDYTVADSNQVALIRRFYPKLNIAFDITEPRQLAWALSAKTDPSLYDEVTKFFNKIKQDKTLEQLLERHYGHAEVLSYVGNCVFRQHIKSRLPKYRPFFIAAAAQYPVDWRLLAAIGYQESHWLNDAVSPTGVQGIMMLTRRTAQQVGINNRNNPQQSIVGGARYFHQRLKKIPQRIPEPDRIWFALASYNVGLGHLEDARILTQQQGGNPDKWMDVKKRLPLLSQKKWYSQTKHGYARGKEPVRFVENIRNYYDLLIWLTEENVIKKNAMTEKTKEALVDAENPILNSVPSAL
ncbi:MAG: membrane-bound lytic murein transglycosylase MltF [Gammaproteobacteria bacterium]